MNEMNRVTQMYESIYPSHIAAYKSVMLWILSVVAQ